MIAALADLIVAGPVGVLGLVFLGLGVWDRRREARRVEYVVGIDFGDPVASKGIGVVMEHDRATGVLTIVGHHSMEYAEVVDSLGHGAANASAYSAELLGPFREWSWRSGPPRRRWGRRG